MRCLIMGLACSACGPATANDRLLAEYPAGVTVAGETLRPEPDTQGWASVGAGWCHPGDNSPWAKSISHRHATILCWSGNPEGDLIHATGAFWRLSRMSLLGWQSRAERDELARKPGGSAGIWVAHNGRFGGAKGVIEEVGFAGFDCAVRLGNANDGNNDHLTIRKVVSHSCGSLLEIASPQAMATSIDGALVRNCRQVILSSGGGDLAVRNLDTSSNHTLLRVTGDARKVGPNNGAFLFDTVKVDNAQHGATFTLVDERADAHLRVTIRDLRLPVARGTLKARAVLRGRNSRLVISDAKNLPADTRFELHNGAVVMVHGSDLGCQPSRLLSADSTGGTVIVRDCWRGSTLIAHEEVSRPHK